MSKQTFGYELFLENEWANRFLSSQYQRGPGDLPANVIRHAGLGRRMTGLGAGSLPPAGGYSSAPALDWSGKYNGYEAASGMSTTTYLIVGGLLIAFLYSRQ